MYMDLENSNKFYMATVLGGQSTEKLLIDDDWVVQLLCCNKCLETAW